MNIRDMQEGITCPFVLQGFQLQQKLFIAQLAPDLFIGLTDEIGIPGCSDIIVELYPVVATDILQDAQSAELLPSGKRIFDWAERKNLFCTD